MAEENNSSDALEDFQGLAGPGVDMQGAGLNQPNPLADRVSAIRQKYNIQTPSVVKGVPQPGEMVSPSQMLSNLNAQSSAIDGIEKNEVLSPQDTLNAFLDQTDVYGLGSSPTDPFKELKNIEGDFQNSHIQNQFYDRYANHSEFKNLGFNPFRDNESLYNAHTSTWEEMGRASSQWMTLTGLGMQDAFGFGDLSDREVAKEYEEAMAIGSSSMGGVGGFMSNLYLNSGYTVGIMAELALEELAMAAGQAALGTATAASGGILSPITGATSVGLAARMAARANRAFGKIGKAFDVASDLGRTLTNFKDASKARKFFSNAGKKTFDFINPLENTVDFLGNTRKLKGINGLAKTSKGFGAFYRDVRNARLAFGEGALEGGMVENEMARDMHQHFIDKEGRPPNAEESKVIRDTANKAGRTTAKINAPVIMLSNKLTFDGLARGKFKKIGTDIIDSGIARKIIINPKAEIGKVFAAAPKKFQIAKRIAMNAKNPMLLYRGVAKYGKANWAEGLQETLQETISGATKDHYGGIYKGTANRGGFLSSVGSNLKKQVSHQGFETFLSGFLMGGMIAPVSSAIGAVTSGKSQTLSDIHLKFSDPQKYEQEVIKRNNKLNETVDTLNELYKDPRAYFNPNMENAESQKEYAEGMTSAQKDNDAKTYYDMKNSSGATHILTALRTGTLDTFKQRMQEQKQLTDEEVRTDYDMSKEEFDAELDGSLKQANEIERRFNLMQKKYPNPFDPTKYDKSDPQFVDEALRQNSWAKATEDLIFMQDSFDNALKRKTSILNNLKNVAGLENTSAAEFAHVDDLRSMSNEIELLKGETQRIDSEVENITDPNLKKVREYKVKKLEALEKYRDLVQKNIYENTSEDETLTDEERKELVDAFTNYSKIVAEEAGDFTDTSLLQAAANDNIDAQFLGDRASKINESVNVLVDGENFIRKFERDVSLNKVIYNQREQEIRKSLEEFLKLKDTNDMLGELATELEENNMFIDPEDLSKMIKTGEVPKRIYNIGNQSDARKNQVDYRSKDYKKAVGIFKKYVEHIHGIKISAAEIDPYFLNTTTKEATDKRKYKDYAEQFGFEVDSESSEVPLTQVLTAITESEFATDAEKALALKLLETVDKKEKVTFVNNATEVGNYSALDQTIIDARYSSEEFKEGASGPKLESVILKQELTRRLSESLTDDTEFSNKIEALRKEAEIAFTEMPIQDKARLFGDDGRKIPFGLMNIQDFVQASMTDSKFQEFLAMTQSNVTVETESNWKAFVNIVLDKLKNLFNKPGGTVLNAAMDIITNQIDSKFSPTSQKTKKGKTITESKPKTKTTTPKYTLEELMNIDDGALAKEVVADYIRINKGRVEDGNAPLLAGFDTMTEEEIMQSPQFKKFLEDPQWRKKEEIIRNYQPKAQPATTVETIEEELDKATLEEIKRIKGENVAYTQEEYNEIKEKLRKDKKFIESISPKETEVKKPIEVEQKVEIPLDSEDITNREYQAWANTGKLSQNAIYRLAQKVINRTARTREEVAIMQNTETMAEINELLVEISKGFPKVIRSKMKRQLVQMGYSPKSIKGMNAQTAQTYIWQGLTFEERQERENQKSQISEETKQRVNTFNNDVIDLYRSAKTLEELNNVEDEILMKYNELDFEAQKLVNLLQEDLDSRKEERLNEIAFTIQFSDIEMGQLLILNNKYESPVRVIGKSNTGITVQYQNGNRDQFDIEMNKIEEEIKYKYSDALVEAMKESEAEITPEDESNSQVTNTNLDQDLQDSEAAQNDIDQSEGKSSEELSENFLDKIC